MVQAIVRIDEDTNRVLNIVKAKYGLKDKSQAINIMAQQYKQEILEPELRPEYINKLQTLEKQKGVPFKTVGQLRRIIEG